MQLIPGNNAGTFRAYSSYILPNTSFSNASSLWMRRCVPYYTTNSAIKTLPGMLNTKPVEISSYPTFRYRLDSVKSNKHGLSQAGDHRLAVLQYSIDDRESEQPIMCYNYCSYCLQCLWCLTSIILLALN